jgi:glycosyltransferase involved in cell wall biosynthesis
MCLLAPSGDLAYSAAERNFWCSGERVRILHLSSLYPPRVLGGAEKVVSVLAETQAALGHEVGASFLVPEPEESATVRGVRLFPLRGRNPLWIEESAKSPAPVRVLNKLYTAVNLRSSEEFGAVIESFAPDVVHTHSLVEFSPLVWRAAKRRRVPLVHTLHDYDALCVRASLYKGGKPCRPRHLGCAVISHWKTRFLQSVDEVVAVSRSVLDVHRRYEALRTFEDGRTAVIWNPVAPTGALQDAVRPRSDVAGPIVFGFLGRVVPEKGIEVLLDACRALPDGGWRLKVAGRAPSGLDPFVERAKGLPVDFLGFADPDEFLSGIDVLVVPSIWAEPFGLTIFEAYRAGIPVIGSDSGAVGEIVGRVDRNWVVRSSDPAALAGRMRVVLEAGRSALPGKAAFAQAVEEVEPVRVAGNYLEIYERALRRAGSRTPAAPKNNKE